MPEENTPKNPAEHDSFAKALYTFGRAVYDIGRNDGSHMETGHAGRVELPTPAET